MSLYETIQADMYKAMINYEKFKSSTVTLHYVIIRRNHRD